MPRAVPFVPTGRKTHSITLQPPLKTVGYFPSIPAFHRSLPGSKFQFYFRDVAHADRARESGIVD